MPKVSIVSLIYQSPSLADWVVESVRKFTPMVRRGEAEFFFVANDPDLRLLRHLRDKGYPYVVNVNRHYSDQELFALGYASPEYMSRVYRGYNHGVRVARGDYVVLINSDNYFSPDWLENLLKYSDRSRVISSTLVERHHPQFSVFPGALHGEFGSTPTTFNEAGFLDFASRVKKTGLEEGGAYMPSLFHRDVALEAGLYPTGNIAGSSADQVIRYGDEEFFDRLLALGVRHYTALDSISYHLKEGERAAGPGVHDNETHTDEVITFDPTLAVPYPIKPTIEAVRDSMAPSSRHEELVTRLVVDLVESPSTRTMRQLVASGLLDAEQEALMRAEIARRTEASRLDAQARAFRRRVARLVGEGRVGPVMRIVHSISWIARPVRRALARRGPTP
ncbi:MAG: glycosyltransferase family 2 protein [Minisyncoccia bacterium]